MEQKPPTENPEGPKFKGAAGRAFVARWGMSNMKYRCHDNFSLRTLIILSAWLTFASCSQSSRTAEPAKKGFDVNALIRPLRFGDRLDPLGKPFALTLVSPSQFRPFVDVTLSSGIRALAILGDEDRICRVRILDKRFTIHSLSMTTTYKEIKAGFPAAKTISYDGYGIEVPIKENVIFCFFPWGGEPKDDQIPSWVDLLPESREDYCRYAVARW